MLKTLTVTIEDVDKADNISISGWLNEKEFNKNIILSLGSHKIQLDSQELAMALKTVVEFQSRFETDGSKL